MEEAKAYSTFDISSFKGTILLYYKTRYPQYQFNINEDGVKVGFISKNNKELCIKVQGVFVPAGGGSEEKFDRKVSKEDLQEILNYVENMRFGNVQYYNCSNLRFVDKNGDETNNINLCTGVRSTVVHLEQGKKPEGKPYDWYADSIKQTGNSAPSLV